MVSIEETLPGGRFDKLQAAQGCNQVKPRFVRVIGPRGGLRDHHASLRVLLNSEKHALPSRPWERSQCVIAVSVRVITDLTFD